MVDFSVTLASLRKAGACINGYNRLVRAIQGKEFGPDDRLRSSYIRFAHKDKIPLLRILASNGLDDALWALRCTSGCDRDMRLFAVWCARQVQHLMADERSVSALDVSERFANGHATHGELDAAWAAACDAACDAASHAASHAARDAACDAACDAAWAAASAAAWDAAWDAARDAAWDAAWDAARDAAWDAARDAQKQMFIAMCNGSAPWQGCV